MPIKSIFGSIGRLFHRKEKFKKLIYKEKIAIYKELAEGLWEFYKTAIDHLFLTAKDEEFSDKLANVCDIMERGSIFIAKDVYEEIGRLLRDLRFSLGIDIPGERIDPMGREERLVLINKMYEESINLMRHDLRSDLVTDSIHGTLDFLNMIEKRVHLGKGGGVLKERPKHIKKEPTNNQGDKDV